MTISSLRKVAIFLAVPVLCCQVSAARDGVAYLQQSDVIVYGGSHWYGASKEETSHTLYIERPDANSGRSLYTSPGVISELEASPAGNLVAFIERRFEENVGRDRGNFVIQGLDRTGTFVQFFNFYESRLVIMSTDGSVRASIVGAERFSWSPDGEKIAYITGTPIEDKYGFISTGTRIFDLSSRKETSVLGGGYELEWAKWDNNLYVKDHRLDRGGTPVVMQVNPSSGAASETTRRGIHFSPDGKYYFLIGGEGVAVYLTADDRPLPLKFTVPTEDGTQIPAPMAAGWLEGNLLVVPSQDLENKGDYLFDVAAGTSRFVRGRVVPSAHVGEVLVFQGRSLHRQTRASLLN